MASHNFSEYEQLLAEVTMNAGEKIINAAVLFNTKHAYRESLFLLLIAQEELSKFILLPFANAADQLNELTDIRKHKGPYFNHRIKQEVFTSFGLQNRTFEQLEEIKQNCLYAGIDKTGRVGRHVAKHEDTHDELCHATKLYIHLAVYNLMYAKPLQVSPELKKILAGFTNGIFIPALKNIVPTVIVDTQNYTLKRNNEDMDILSSITQGDIVANRNFHQLLITSPFMYTDMLSYVLGPDDYKNYFKEIVGMNIDEMVKHLKNYIS